MNPQPSDTAHPHVARFARADANAIGVLRLVFALLVVVSHAFALGGFGHDPLWRLSQGTRDLGDLGVDGFFVLSGFLIAQSWLRSQGLAPFLAARCLRIFPALWLCLGITALGVGFLAQHLQHGAGAEFFLTRTNGPYAYVLNNVFLYPTRNVLLDCFSENPVPWVFNNSLWTLPREFGCYLVACLLGLLGGLRRRPWLLAAGFFLAWAIYLWSRLPAGAMIAEAVPWRNLRLPMYFLSGCAACVWLRPGFFDLRVIAPLGLALAAATAAGLYDWVAPLALPLVLLNLAARVPVRGVEKRLGDYSYGIYLYGFPVQQLLVLLGVHHFGLVAYVAAALVPVTALAVLSWHLVEKPALALKPGRPRARAATPPRETPLPVP
jgi:peptidoglycan/LPS O-acetylase OafA/YrhL